MALYIRDYYKPLASPPREGRALAAAGLVESCRRDFLQEALILFGPRMGLFPWRKIVIPKELEPP